MTQIKSLAVGVFATALISGFAVSSAQATAVGRTAGTYSVTPAGAATYTIPIFSPKGPHGVQPQIALVYNSQQGNGYVGVGWAVSGLSSIYRCNKTVAQDGIATPVALAVSDGYCMDGQRLRLTAGTYGVANSTYETEIANFVHVQAIGTAGSGPASWAATTKNGWIYTYGVGGTTSNAAVVVGGGNNTVVSWQLNQVTDNYGNTMTITYSTNNANAQVVPNVISWVPASHGSSTYNYTMTFAYTAAGSIHGYIDGTAVNNTNLLSSIAIAYQNSAVKTYYLTYSNNTTATSRNLLTTVQECAGTGTSNCLTPTTATYQPGTGGVGSGTPLTGASGYVVSTAYDFNGDGINDLLIRSSTGAYSVALGGTGGYGEPQATGISGGTVLVGDIDGSGVDSIVWNNGGIWYYSKWNGSGFPGQSTGVAMLATSGQALADVNGDGRADIVQAESDGYIHVQLSQSTSGNVSFGSDINTLISLAEDLSSSSLSSREFHFWGSNQDDIVEDYSSCIAYNKNICTQYEDYHTELDFTGSTFNVVNGFNNTSRVPDSGGAVDIADYNDDGCTDVLTSTQLMLSGCDGSNPVVVNLPSGVTPIGGMDWNGDGRRDVLVAQSNGYVGVLLSTGTGVSSTVTNTSIPYTAGSSYVAATNLTGDGQDGLVVSNGTTITYYLPASPGSPPDLLSSVTDAFGNSASPTYTTLAYGNVYTNNGGGAYPDANYVGPMYVVGSTTFSDPSAVGGTYTTSNTYLGGLINMEGRGFDGFNGVKTIDNRNQVQEATYFNQVFPYTGIVSSAARSVNSQTLSSVSNTLAPLVTLSSAQYQQRYMPYVSSSVTKQYEYGGPENDTLITTVNTSEALDNLGNMTSATRTVTDNDPNSPTPGQSWTQMISNVPVESTSPIYCANLVSSTQTEYTASVGDTVTIAKSITPDSSVHCDYSQIVTQPGTLYSVAEALGHDDFGNINSDSVTGNGMVARTMTTNWTGPSSTTGQFPQSVTDPSGAQTQLTYNYSFGVPYSITDANGLTTSWQYLDGFGRKTQENRPDGTSSTFGYLDMYNEGYGYHAILAQSTVYDSNGGYISDHDSGYDQVGRQVVQADRNLSGGYNQTTVKYDALGRVAARSAPCAFIAWPTTCPYSTTYAYDILNRPIQSQPQGFGATVYTYSGRATITKDANGHSNTVFTGVDGTLRQITDANGYTVIHGYDAAGTRVSTTDNQGRTLWSATNVAYGIKPFILNSSDSALGPRSYTVDAMGEVTNYSDGNGSNFSATYDALGRMTTRTEPDLFTQWTWGTAAASDNIGKLQSVCTGPGTNSTTTPVCAASGYSESESYDGKGRLYQRQITIPNTSVAGGTYTYVYAYNAGGELSTLTYPATVGTPLQLRYAYANGFLTSITDISDSQNVTLWTANTANPAGQITQETLGNGVQINRIYDPIQMWLNSLSAGVTGSGTALETQGYLHDDAGNVTQRQQSTPNLALSENFYYDNLNRLSHSQMGSATNLQMCYDNAGGGCATNVAGPGMITGRIGDPISRGTYTAQWTSYNYLLNLTAGPESVQFQYGPDRSRWQQVYSNTNTGTETTNYIGGSLEQVVTSSGTTYRSYVYAGNEPVAIQNRTTSASTWSYMLSDHQGSIAALMDDSGNITVNESFTAYGTRRNAATWSGAASSADLSTSASISRQGYTFQTALGAAMGLNHMNGRVQDAITGQFLSPDPTIPYPTNTQSYYRYSYARNNPLTLVDPTGFDDKACGPDGCTGGSGSDYTSGSGADSIASSTANSLFPNPFDNIGSSDDSSSTDGSDSPLQVVTVSAPRSYAPIDPDLALAAFDAGLIGRWSTAPSVWSRIGSVFGGLKAHPVLLVAMVLATTAQPEGPGEAADVAMAAAAGVDLSAAAESAAAIQTPYNLEVQSASAEALAALDAAQNGATLYRTGTLGSNMAGESQYWSLENPLTTPGYAGQMGVPSGTPNFVLQGTLNPGASVITNVAPGLGTNVGGGIQIVTSPGGVGHLIFTMPF